MKIKINSNGRALFYCVACLDLHVFDVNTWSFNNDQEKPTITPSLLVTGPSRFLTDDEYDRLVKGEDVSVSAMRCHSFITDGQIYYLEDCTHAYAGKTIPLPDIPSYLLEVMR